MNRYLNHRMWFAICALALNSCKGVANSSSKNASVTKSAGIERTLTSFVAVKYRRDLSQGSNSAILNTYDIGKQIILSPIGADSFNDYANQELEHQDILLKSIYSDGSVDIEYAGWSKYHVDVEKKALSDPDKSHFKILSMKAIPLNKMSEAKFLVHQAQGDFLEKNYSPLGHAIAGGDKWNCQDMADGVFNAIPDYTGK